QRLALTQKLPALSGAAWLVDPQLHVARLDKADSQGVEIRQRGLGRQIEVDAHPQGLGIKAEINVLDRPARDHRHGAAFILASVMAGVEPLEKGFAAVDLDVEKAARQRVHGLLAAAADGPAQFRRRLVPEEQISVLQVLAEEIIEQ